jgi:TetR/AcrR family transcriptional regulator
MIVATLSGLDHLIKNEHTAHMSKIKTQPAVKTRIQSENQDLILAAALDVFSTYGFRGATVDQIAAKCGLSKPNLLYYFRRKEDLYVAVLEHTLTEWLTPLRMLDVNNDPIIELSRYIEAKLEMSFANPAASKLFANEILHGAPHISKYLNGHLRDLVEAKSAVIRQWVADEKINAVDPHHFIFAIWAVTQHYADFSTQVEALLGPKRDVAKIKVAVLDILLRGLQKN